MWITWIPWNRLYPSFCPVSVSLSHPKIKCLKKESSAGTAAAQLNEKSGGKVRKVVDIRVCTIRYDSSKNKALLKIQITSGFGCDLNFYAQAECV